MTRSSILKLMFCIYECVSWQLTLLSFVFVFFRFIMLSTPSMPVVPMKWASQPISGCGYWSFRTWMETVTGGWGRQEASEVMCLPTTSANQNTHEQALWCWWCLRLYFYRKKTHSASKTEQKDKRAFGHTDFSFGLLSWSLIVRTDYCCWLSS